MTNEENVSEEAEKKATSTAMIVKTRLIEIAAKATVEDIQAVKNLIETAEGGQLDAQVVTMSAAACALIFLQHNNYNRDWRPEKTLEYEREIRDKQWRWNNQSVGFYTDGALADGQHRFSGHALAGESFKVIVGFNVAKEAIVTIDTNTKRNAGDAGKLQGVAESKVKTGMVKFAASYMVKAGDKSAMIKSETEVLNEVKKFNEVLDIAIEIGAICGQNIVTPVLPVAEAQKNAFLLLRSGEDRKLVHQELTLLQSGQSTVGDNEPLFTAASLIVANREANKKREHLSKQKEAGLIVAAIQLRRQGKMSVQAKTLRGMVKGTGPLPDPRQIEREAVA